MIDEASATIAETREAISEPELWRLRARLEASVGNKAQALENATKAIRMAEKEGADRWKNRAEQDLASLS
jgi:hypothetical protein